MAKDSQAHTAACIHTATLTHPNRSLLSKSKACAVVASSCCEVAAWMPCGGGWGATTAAVLFTLPHHSASSQEQGSSLLLRPCTRRTQDVNTLQQTTQLCTRSQCTSTSSGHSAARSRDAKVHSKVLLRQTPTKAVVTGKQITKLSTSSHMHTHTHTPTGRAAGTAAMPHCRCCCCCSPGHVCAQTPVCPWPAGACPAQKEMPHPTQRLLRKPCWCLTPPQHTHARVSLQLPPLSAL